MTGFDPLQPSDARTTLIEATLPPVGLPMVETTYVTINTGRSRLAQILALILLTFGVVLLHFFRSQAVGAIAPVLLVFPALGLVRLSRSFMDRVKYNPPRSEAERQLLRRYGLIKRTFGLLFCASLVVLEYCAALRWGGAIAIIGIEMIALLCFGMFAYAVSQNERFQRRPLG